MRHHLNVASLTALCSLLFVATIPAAALDTAGPINAPARPADIYENLFPPEMIVRFGPEIGISQDQLTAIRTEMQTLRPNFEAAQEKLRADTTVLNDLVKQLHPDVPACLAQLDKVLDDERAIKRENLQFALKIRATLTPQQIAQLTALREKQTPAGPGGNPAGPPLALRNKMQEVQTLAQKLRQDGKDLGNVPTEMQNAKSAAQDGNYKAAEEQLDKVLLHLKSL